MAYGKAIELFLVNGTADSLITAGLSNDQGMELLILHGGKSDCTIIDEGNCGQSYYDKTVQSEW